MKRIDRLRFWLCQFTSIRNIIAKITFITTKATGTGAFADSTFGAHRHGGFDTGQIFNNEWGDLSLFFNASISTPTGTENKPYSILAVPIYVY